MADQLAKSGAFFELPLTLNIEAIPGKRFNLAIRSNNQTLIPDIHPKHLIEKFNSLNDAIKLKATPPFIKTINKNILLQMDWKFTMNNIFKDKITDKSTNPQQEARNKFHLKTFLNKLPTLNEMHGRYPSVYNNDTCPHQNYI